MFVLFLAASAFADDRDDDIFGPSEPSPTEPAAPAPTERAQPSPTEPAPTEPAQPSPTEPAPTEPAQPSPTEPQKTTPPGETVGFGDVEIRPTTSADIASRLATADERLTIGGKLFLRANASITEDTDLKDQAISTPNLLDLFADVRPNDRVRGFASGRFNYNFAIQDGDVDRFGNTLTAATVKLDQVWVKFDVARIAYVTTGRQRIKWGSGRFWNPTDFLNQQTLDALNASVFDERTGVALLKVHVPIESIGANLYGIGNFEGADSFESIGGALRTEWLLGPAEIALSAAAREGAPLRLGADATAAVGPFDLRVEAAVKHGDETPYFKGEYDLASLTIPKRTDRSDEWIPQVVAGAEIAIKYSDRDSVYIGAEYFYNGAGYKDASLYPWLLGASSYYEAIGEDALATSTQKLFTPFYLGQHYVGAYAMFPSPGRWDEGSITASTLANISDQSYVSRLDVSVKALTFLTLSAYTQVHYGETGEFRFSYEIEPIPGILDDGFSIPAPVVGVGVGAMINF